MFTNSKNFLISFSKRLVSPYVQGVCFYSIYYSNQ